MKHVITDRLLVSGNVPFVTAGGKLTDVTGLTWDGATLAVPGNIRVSGVRGAYRESAISTAVGIADYTIVATAVITVTFPACATVVGQVFNVKNRSGGVVTVNPTGGELLDASATLSVPDTSNLCAQARATGGYVIL